MLAALWLPAVSGNFASEFRMSNYVWYMLRGDIIRPVDPDDYAGVEVFVWGNGCYHIVVGTARNVTTLTQRRARIGFDPSGAGCLASHVLASHVLALMPLP